MKPNKVKTSKPAGIGSGDDADDLEIARLERLLGRKAGKEKDTGLEAELIRR